RSSGGVVNRRRPCERSVLRSNRGSMAIGPKPLHGIGFTLTSGHEQNRERAGTTPVSRAQPLARVCSCWSFPPFRLLQKRHQTHSCRKLRVILAARILD